MRRPLLFLCVCLFVLIALSMQMVNPPPWSSEIVVSEAENIFVVGQVYKKEYKKIFDEETIIFYLDVINYSNEAKASYHEIYQKLNKKTSPNLTKIICEMYISDLPYRENGEVFLPYLGETVLVQGNWQEFAHATNPGEFDYANYYAIEGVSGKVKNTQLLVSDQRKWHVRELLFRIRQRWLQNLYDTFEQKEAAILAKMLLGDGSGLDKEVRDLYQENGIVHILSISGVHISLIGMGIYKLLRKGSMPVCVAAVLGGVSIILYGMMIGFGVSACRAIGMYLIHMLGEIWGKTYDMLTAMGVWAFIMVLENPRLVYHSGYLLSFASVCGLGLLAPLLPKAPEIMSIRPYDKIVIKWVKKRGAEVWSSLMVSLSVTLFTLPIQLFFFFKIPVYSVIINLLVIPFMSIVMTIGFVVMLIPAAGFLCPIESLIFVWFEWLCQMFQHLPAHTWLTGRPQIWKILLYYVVLIVVVVVGKRMRKPVIMGTLATLVLFVGVRLQREAGITFLDVGQGDCICVQTTSGECYLFDGGSSSRTKVGETVIIPYLQYCGITKLDAVFVSHPDEDHTNGLEELINSEEVAVERLVLPQVANVKEEFAALLTTVAKDTMVEYVVRDEVFCTKDLQITCLHPAKNYASDTNEYSACYLLEIGEICVLFTGDVEGMGEEDLIQTLKESGVSQIDVLKVAHHGSRYSTTEEFLNVVDVEMAVISCGKDNIYGHPHIETLNRLSSTGSVILTTPQYGAITIKVSKDGNGSVSYWGNSGLSD